MTSVQGPYRVLARKYRPRNFDELIGQEALVRTLTNAIGSGRIAHAFMLTGVRGIGKTTTARIIAKALNYTGPDGAAGPTAGATDDCGICQAIAEDRHPDVIEMDAASRTGIDDIREILDGVRYAPVEARYKIYIIDEVHMLSKQAFNALLKTLEEPPPHVKFIFATTEIRKVPVTVLSRCQRFDLRRVDAPTLIAHFKKIGGLEHFTAEDDALALIARAADGSVRDGLSLLDQAIALGDGHVTLAQAKIMLGLSDRGRALDLLEHALRGQAADTLGLLADLHRSGADPLVIVQDMLDLTHSLTKLRAAPDHAGAQAGLNGDPQRLIALSQQLSMPVLAKTWQIFLKGLAEVQAAPHPQMAAEMLFLRLIYAADLPDPADLVRRLQQETPGTSVPAPAAPPQTVQRGHGGGGQNLALAPAMEPAAQPPVHTQPRSLEDIVALLDAHDEPLLSSQVYQFVHLVKIEDGRLEMRLQEHAPVSLSQDLARHLTRLTGRRWMVSVSKAAGSETLAGRDGARRAALFESVLRLPVIEDIMKVFPGAELKDIK